MCVVVDEFLWQFQLFVVFDIYEDEGVVLFIEILEVFFFQKNLFDGVNCVEVFVEFGVVYQVFYFDLVECVVFVGFDCIVFYCYLEFVVMFNNVVWMDFVVVDFYYLNVYVDVL